MVGGRIHRIAVVGRSETGKTLLVVALLKALSRMRGVRVLVNVEELRQIRYLKVGGARERPPVVEEYRFQVHKSRTDPVVGHIVDTPGLQEPPGRRRECFRAAAVTFRALLEATAVLYVLAPTLHPGDQGLNLDQELIRYASGRRPTLVVVNKCDLPGAAELVRWARRVNRTPVRAVSALTSEGIAELAQLMLQRLLRAEV